MTTDIIFNDIKMTIPTQWHQLISIFLEYNSQINLSAIRDAEGVYIKHILDSLELLKILDMHTLKKGTVADIGTGGGFPLLPLAMSLPEVIFTGIDSVRKKIQAIELIAQTLQLSNVSLLRTRIEELNKKFDIVTARAVAHVDKLIPRSQSLLRRGSKLVLYKEYKQEEKNAMMILAKEYNMSLEVEHHYVLMDGDIDRVLYILLKQ